MRRIRGADNSRGIQIGLGGVVLLNVAIYAVVTRRWRPVAAPIQLARSNANATAQRMAHIRKRVRSVLAFAVPASRDLTP